MVAVESQRLSLYGIVKSRATVHLCVSGSHKLRGLLRHGAWKLLPLLCLPALLLAACTPSGDIPSAEVGGGGRSSLAPSEMQNRFADAWAAFVQTQREAGASSEDALDPEDTIGAIATAPTLAAAEEVSAKYRGAVPIFWGLEVPGVLTSMDSDGIAITLDACGGSGGDGYDAELIDGLIARQVPATLFLNERWINANPDLARALAENPLFEIANHGTSHLPLSVSGQAAYGIPGTSSPLEAAREVRFNHVTITELTGKSPRFFRSGTAHYDEVAVQIAQDFGEGVLGFTVNGDAGATFSAEEVRRQVAGAGPGSIIIAHMNQPAGQTAEGLLAGVDDALARGMHFTLLENPR